MFKIGKRDTAKNEKAEELDRIVKTLTGRDFELSKIRAEEEAEIKELRIKAKELEETREALLNILDDAEGERTRAVEERNKTLAIINNLTDGLMVFDRKNNLSFINLKAEEMLGIEREKIETKNIKELKKYLSLSPIIDLIFKKNKIKRVEKAEFSSKEGITIEVTTVIIKDLKETECIVILHDISREKIIERLKSEFVSISAHQLRTPLSAIKWSLSLLKEGKMKKREEEDLFDKIFQSNERMIKLINALLDVTRIEEGRYLYSPGKEDIKEIVKQSTKSIEGEAKRKNIQFQLLLPKEKIPRLKIDKEKISFAIQNLAENAVHYTKPGGKVIITVEYHKDKKEIFFKFQDAGVGIPKHQQRRVFSKFFRGENVMRMETEGSGLGLFITKNIIEAHKGKIWFESPTFAKKTSAGKEEKRGSTFYFVIPSA